MPATDRHRMGEPQLRIVIETIPHDEHRYRTAGDWWRDQYGVLQIRVSEMPDQRDVALVALHELIEVMLCEHRGIREEDVTNFDKAHCDHDSDPYADDPGSSPEAPYHNEHVFSEAIERLMSLELDRNWQEHDAALGALDGQRA